MRLADLESHVAEGRRRVVHAVQVMDACFEFNESRQQVLEEERRKVAT